MNRWLMTFWSLAVVLLVGGLGTAILAAEKPTGQLSGVVVTRAKDLPVGEATIYLYGPVRRVLKTDAQGRFQADRLIVGEYRLMAKAKGYQRQWHDNIRIEESKATSDVRFQLYTLEPNLFVAHYQRVFRPEEPIKINVRGTLVDTIHAQVARVNLDALWSHDDPFETLSEGPPTDAMTLVKRWDQPVANVNEEDDWIFHQLSLPKLSEGSYLVSLQGETVIRGIRQRTDKDTYWITVTRLGLVTKRSANELLAFACDLGNGEPRPNVAISAVGGGKRLLGTTNAQGLLRLPLGSDPMTLVAEEGESLARVITSAQESHARYRELLYSDRPIYRPGQTVYFKGILRDKHGPANRLPARDPVRVVIRDSEGESVHTQDLPVNAMGAYSGQTDLSLKAALGEYTLEREQDGDSVHVATFQVQEYRKPEFQLSIQPDSPQVAAGLPLKATVSAAYYFGAPVAGSKVRYTVYSRESYAMPQEDEGFFAGYLDDPYVDDYWSGYGEVVSQAEGTTDANGQLRIELPTQAVTAGAPEDDRFDQRYTIEVEAEDTSRRLVTAREGVLVTQGDWQIVAETDRYIYQRGDSARLTAKALTYDAKTVSVPLTVSLLKREETTDREGNLLDRYRQVWTGRLDTGTSGGLIELPITEAGGYVLHLSGRDGAGRTVTSNVWLWAGDGEFADGPSRLNTLQLVTDKKVYRVGDTCQLLISSPVAKGHLLLTIEGQRLYDTRLIELHSGLQLVSLPVRAEYGSNAYVSATLVGDKVLHQTTKSLNIDPSRHFLTLTVTPQQARYKPGETARLEVQARDANGRPVSCEFSLGVVDQAIYALAPDQTPDPRRVFWGPEDNQIDTRFSFDEDYSGGPPKDQAEPRVRRNFKDTALWLPHLATDANGHALVEVPLPDNLTTWVATARAITSDTQVGSATGAFIATQPLLMRLILPRFATLHDRLDVTALVHNYTDRSQEVDVTLEGWKNANQHLTIPPNGIGRSQWPMQADRLGTFHLRAVAKGETASDAIELPLPVLPHGVAKVETTGGSLIDSADWAVQIPASAVPGSTQLNLALTASPMGTIMEALTYLRHYPYGCVEQTLSRFVPELRVTAARKAFGLNVAESDQAIVQDGLERLYAMQHGDGGWGWWQHDASDARMTAHVLAALGDVPAADPERIRRGVRYLTAQARRQSDDTVTPFFVEKGTGWETQALYQYALSRHGMGQDQALSGLIQRRDKLSDYAVALTLLALPVHDPRADQLLGVLGRRAITNAPSTHWEFRPQADSWLDSAAEATSFALRAYLKHRPDDPKITGAMHYLMTQRQGNRWRNTRETGWVVIGLAEAVVAQYRESANYQAVVLVDGVERGRWYFQGRPDQHESLSLSDLTAGRHTLRIERVGSGPPLLWASDLRYVPEQENIPAESPSGIQVKREHFRLPPAILADNRDALNSNRFEKDTLPRLEPLRGRVKIGEWVLTVLTVTHPQRLDFVLVEDPLPSGWEVMDDPQDSWWYWWSHREVHDDRVALFATYLEAGQHRLYYVARPEVGGRLHQMPTRLEQMYRPEVHAQGAENQWTVSE